MGLFGRVLINLRERGFLATARAGLRRATIVASKVVDASFDARHGTETSRLVEVAEQRDVTSPNRERGIRYEPSRARPLRRLLRELPLPRAGAFVDVGCGKGRAMMVAAQAGFQRLVGVDYSGDLCRTAWRNLEGLARAQGGNFSFEVIECDAADFAFASDHDVIYLFNPFDEVVMARVLDRLEDSLRAHPRSAWIIYLAPKWPETIERRGIFTPFARRTYGGCEFAVYVTPSRTPARDRR
ncbi:MAG: class I SAM-dependent methyltransferase [Candidatus Krumholzibacteria bacterium]|nr:class I SAM-dependent methyltransferase [Candidatus Krumholzibacteria bacterium]